ncbi:permease prefix domain 1-containing protein [Thalassobacillus devorans]|uniref:permease prefix domain 1-containing protein n=1 Tax=Thalassobacillus devorans TaxID=279813 RepID=UPI000A1CADA1|nr:permease prefix domain 1-containing protein [Thalassobacillus devorans]
MKTVDDYVNQLYKQADPKHPDTIEIKEETRVHLNESVDELKKEGYSEERALQTAIERFGGIDQAEKLISLMEIRQKKLAIWLLRAGVISLLLGCVLFVSSLFIGNDNDQHLADIGYQSIEAFAKEDTEQLQRLYEDEALILQATIERNESSSSPDGEVLKQNEFWVPDLLMSERFYRDDAYFVWFEVIDVRNIGFLAFLMGVSFYYVLFTVWSLIRLYHAGRLTMGWTANMLFLNALGYLLFIIKEKRWRWRK